MKRSVSEKVFLALYEEGLINENGETVDEHFREEVKFLVEGVLSRARKNIESQTAPLLKHLLLLKFYSKVDRFIYTNKWRKEAQTFLRNIKLLNCIYRRCVNDVKSDTFEYNKKRVYLSKDYLQSQINNQIDVAAILINNKYNLDIDYFDLQLEDIGGFKVYDNDVQVIKQLSK